MATIKKHGSKYQASVRRAGQRNLYKSFSTKKDAWDWATQREAEIARGDLQDFREASKLSFAECIENYATEELPHRKHPKKLISQLGILRRSELASLSLKNVTAKEITKFKKKRLESVGEATVIKDLNQISAIFNKAIREWYVQLPQGNPVQKVLKPRLKPNSERTRRLDGDEEKRLTEYLGKHSVDTANLMMTALATGMRRGELLNIRLRDVDTDKRVLTIPESKNGYPRVIPLTRNAVEALAAQRITRVLTRAEKIEKEQFLFAMRPDSVTQAFTRACKALGIENLRWHDLRHEAISRLFEMGLDMMEVALISGHRDLSMLKRYTHLRPEKIGEKLRSNASP